jgi:DNA-binding NarL/FixJ family response regulator
LRKLPVIMLTTTDDIRDVERCHQLGCNIYIQKPVDYDRFAEAIQRLGQFVTLLLVPPVKSH